MKTIFEAKNTQFQIDNQDKGNINDYNLQDNQSNIFLLEENNNYYWYFVAKLPNKCGFVREKLTNIKDLSADQNNLIAELIKKNQPVELKFLENNAVKRSRSSFSLNDNDNIYQSQQNNLHHFTKLHFRMRNLLANCQENKSPDGLADLAVKHFSYFQLKNISQDFLINQLKQVAIIFYAKQLINEDDLNNYFEIKSITKLENCSNFKNLLPNSYYNLQEKLPNKEQNIGIIKNEENITSKVTGICKPRAISALENKNFTKEI
jgi:hypothetical protein